MKTSRLGLAVVLAATTGMATAQSRVEGSSSKADLERVTVRTTAGSGGVSVGAFKLNAALGNGTGDVSIANITACDNSTISNSHTDVRMRDVTVRATGSFKVGNISAGC